MSVYHVVLFKLKPEIDMTKVRALADACARAVPGIVELHVSDEKPKIYEGKIDRSAGFTHILVSRHVNAAALKVYATHPEHIKLSKHLLGFATAPPVAGDIFSTSKL